MKFNRSKFGVCNVATAFKVIPGEAGFVTQKK